MPHSLSQGCGAFAFLFPQVHHIEGATMHLVQTMAYLRQQPWPRLPLNSQGIHLDGTPFKSCVPVRRSWPEPTSHRSVLPIRRRASIQGTRPMTQQTHASYPATEFVSPQREDGSMELRMRHLLSPLEGSSTLSGTLLAGSSDLAFVIDAFCI